MHKLKSLHIKLDEKSRLYNCSVPIIGLTGGIASGKSTVSKILKAKGFEVIDADILVKSIYKKPETIEFLKKVVPNVVESSAINFKKLREVFFENAEIKKNLEAFIYSKLPEEFHERMSNNTANNNFVFYDVPLLFEKNLQHRLDTTLCVVTNKSKQLERLISRDEISASLANKIIKSQMPMEQKSKLADFIIYNDQSIIKLEENINEFINNILI